MIAAVAGSVAPLILTVNGGSSTIRFALFRLVPALQRIYEGRIERIGLSGTRLFGVRMADGARDVFTLPADSHRAAAGWLVDWLRQRGLFADVVAVGHRIVHGMQRDAPARVTAALLGELRAIQSRVPEHLPREIALIEALRPHIPVQVACFDTVFHHDMPAVAQYLPIPRRYAREGVRRYGFHGLSYAYLMEALGRLGDPAATRGRVVLAHLGNGASMAAVRDGRSIDTTMGFTPAGGLPMSTRSGDLDPGVIGYLAREAGLSAERINRLLNHESGLLGLSGISGDVRDLLAQEATDAHAAEALALFCYQARKSIGALAAALGGLDTLVFAGGIGENAPAIRARICADLDFLGIRLDTRRNADSADLISIDTGRVAVRVIATDEALMIARATAELLQPSSTRDF